MKKIYCFIFGHRILWDKNTLKGTACANGCGKSFSEEEINDRINRLIEDN